MTSKTQIISLVKELKWKQVDSSLNDAPDLIACTDAKGRNWLHLCCGIDIEKNSLNAKDSIKMAEVLLAKGLDVNGEAFKEGSWLATPLWYSIARGKNTALARYLLKRGADPNHCLWAAVYNDDINVIRLLIRSGAEIDPITEDETPLLFAIKISRFKAAELLLKQGADPNYQDSKKMTALHYMLKKGSPIEQVEMVLKHGAQGNIKNKEGKTAKELMMRKKNQAYQKLASKFFK